MKLASSILVHGIFTPLFLLGSFVVEASLANGPSVILANHRNQLQEQLPPHLIMRLPDDRWLRELLTAEESYAVRFIPASADEGLAIGLFSCDDISPDCLIGSFSTLEATSTGAQASLQQHQAAAAPITLAPEVTGYLLDGARLTPQALLSSVVWVQDNQLYAVRFPAEMRQTGLYLARSMAIANPISGEADLAIVPTNTEGTASPVIESVNSIPDATDVERSSAEESTAPSLNAPAGITLLPSAESFDSSSPIAQTSTPPRFDEFTPESSSSQVLGTIEIRGIEVVDTTIFNSDDFLPIFEDVGVQPSLPEGQTQTVNLPQLANLANGITQLYIDQGYITSRAIAPEDFSGVADDGLFRLQVIEGELANISIEGTENLQEGYIRSRLQSGVTSPFRVNRLEEQLRLLQIDPNLNSVEATLRPTGTPGYSDLYVKVEESLVFAGGITIDNYSPPRVGSERIGANVILRNLAGWGDTFSGSYFRSTTGGASVFDLRYAVPLNAMNGTLLFRAAPEQNRVTQAGFEALGLRGSIERYGVQFRQPIIRSINEELALSVGFDFQTGQTFVFNETPQPFGIGPDENGVSRTSVFTFGQDYVSRDSFGAWALRSQFSFGTGLFNATSNPSPIPDGHFFSWLFQGQRLQRLDEQHLLVFGADIQLTPNTLLPAHHFTIGGGQSVRGFRQNARSGDNGFRVSVEDRITVTRLPSGASELQLVPFADLGMVWNTSGNPNFLPDQTILAGAGIGVIWDWFLGLEGLGLRLDYAVPFVDLIDRGNNVQDSGFYFRINYRME